MAVSGRQVTRLDWRKDVEHRRFMDLVKGDMQRSDRGGYLGRGKTEAGDLLSSQKKRRRIPDKKYFFINNIF